MHVVENEPGKELALYERPEIVIAQHVTRTGLIDLPEDLSLEHWKQLLGASKTFSDSMYWIAGDLANYGEGHYGEAYAQFVDILGFDENTLKTAMRVARQVPHSIRRPEPHVPWSYHQAVSGLRKCQEHMYPDDDCDDCEATLEMRAAWLQICAEQEWTREVLRERLREAAGRENKRGRPAKPGSKHKRPKEPAITESDFRKLVNKNLDPR